MEVKIIEPISFCFGVKRAIDLLDKIVEENKTKNLILFGELIHNNLVIENLKNKGVKVMNFTENTAETLLNSLNKNDLIIFSAHGHNKKYEEILNKKGINFLDTTCPIVEANLRKIEKNNGVIIFIGKAGHPETIASLSRSKNIFLYDINSEFDYKKIDKDIKEVYVMNQTTLSFLELERIFKDIKEHFPNAHFSDEICNASRIRQEKITTLDSSFDLVLILGDKKSSNTTKLYDLSNKNKSHDTFFVSGILDLEKIDFSKYKKVAIFSGTSCPMEFIEEVKKKVEEI